MAGYYWGDMPDYTDPIACEIIANSSDVPEEDRAPTAWPHMFSVEMRGADRWPRASPSSNASCNYSTDCSPYNASQEGMPNPPTVWGHWYAGIRGTSYLDHNPGQYGGGLLRHETVYQFPSGEAGRDRQAKGLQGERNMHLTEIHVQTPEMADRADPGIMLNLVHMNWTNPDGTGMTTIDDDLLDWRRLPSPPLTDQVLGKAMCVCVPDPAGLPDFMDAYSNATYKGRVKFIPPWQQTGSYGPPSTTPIVADHWVKWTFHLYVDIETKLPVLFSSPFGGIATYGNFSKPDELWPKDFNGGWKNLPARDKCFDPTHEAATCKDYIPEVTTTTTTPAPKHTKEIATGVMKGLLADTDDFETCSMDAMSAGAMFGAAAADLKAGKPLDAITDLSIALGKIQPTVTDCEVVKDEVAKLAKELKDINVKKAMQNFQQQRSAILQDLADASTAKDAEKFEEYGMHLGFAIRKVIAEDGMIV